MTVLGYAKPLVDHESVTIPISIPGGGASLQWPLKMFVEMASQVIGPIRAAEGVKRKPTVEMAYELWKNGTRNLSRRVICRQFKIRYCDFVEYERRRACEDEMAACDQRVICLLSRDRNAA